MHTRIAAGVARAFQAVDEGINAAVTTDMLVGVRKNVGVAVGRVWVQSYSLLRRVGRVRRDFVGEGVVVSGIQQSA